MIETIGAHEYGIRKYFLQKSIPVLFGMFFLIDSIYVFSTSFVVSIFDESLLETPFDKLPPFKVFVTTVIMAPLLETLVFQVLVIEVLRRFSVSMKYAIFISGLVFGSVHQYNVAYMIAIFFSGLLYAYAYVIVRYRLSIFRSALFLISLHALGNLMTFFVNHLSKTLS
ncbi:CPBP family intramembrane glutamic endopeptidase [Olivibacter sp. CPCC 100613]|uniref:CPBP family intramembrane glutamic endopeptidase n=1 Tax=Olivibacter sp. CPCC 100613 TaxID=3079931 RepID=UPI002FF9B04D